MSWTRKFDAPIAAPASGGVRRDGAFYRRDPPTRLLTAEHRQFNIALAYGLSASQKALRLSSLYSDAMNATNEWHRWYAWHPVICDNASGGVAWGLTI